jgi:prepilin-type N-terminal cleavage/methylation domain-containing protein
MTRAHRRVLDVSPPVRRSAPPIARRPRRGFTLMEVMVTVLLLSVGMAGLIATSSAVSRMMGGAQQQIRAATVATNRFEALRATRCTALASGSATQGSITERWFVRQLSAVMYDVVDSVTYRPMSRRTLTTTAFRSYVAC